MRFSCTMRGGKVLSLCEASSGLSYRFGPPGALELRIPDEGYSDGFVRARVPFGEDGEVVTTSTWNDGHRYAVEVRRVEDMFEADLTVRKGAEELAKLKCRDDVAADLTDLGTRYPGDPGQDLDWVGHWVGGEASITIQSTPDGLHATGESAWHGRNPGQIHTGELDGPLTRVDATHLRYATDGCEVELAWTGPDAFDAESNTGCGGVNVSFSWNYQRRP